MRESIVDISTKEMTRRFGNEITLEQVFDDIVTCFRIDPARLKSESRYRDLVTVRQIYCFVAKSMTNHTLREIGALIGDRDHTTIISSIRKVKRFIGTKDATFMDFWDKYTKRTNIYNEMLIVNHIR